MNILITGGCGFIGSHVAERLSKEGHNIFIIDNLSNGNSQNIRTKNVLFKLSIEDKKCEEVFKSYNFDSVIHLAAQTDTNVSKTNPYDDAQSNLFGLVNILNLSTKYQVGSFIFASSAAVYGEAHNIPIKEIEPSNPVSAYGLHKNMGERYCAKYSELYGIRTVCLRFANVYGPKQGLSKEDGVISTFIKRILDNQPLSVWGDGTQTRDFLYVEDLVDAIFRALQMNVSGEYNISTNKEYSINNLLELFNQFHPFKDVVYKSQREGDLQRSCLDNSKAIKELDWKIKYSLEEGLEKTFKWYMENYNSTQVEDVSATERSGFFRSNSLLPYFENILAFFSTFFISYKGYQNPIGFSIPVLDLNIVYIFMMSSIYGARQGILSMLLTCISFVAIQFLVKGEIASLTYNIDSMMQIFVYIIVGVVTSYISDAKSREVKTVKAHLENTKEELAFVKDVHGQVVEVKEKLYEQVLNTENSLASMYSISVELNSLQMEDIFYGAIKVVENVMKTESVSIYSFNEDSSFIRLTVKSKDLIIEKNSISLTDLQDMQKSIKNRVIFINRKLQKDYPMMAAPVTDGDRILALIFIHDIKFENITKQYENLFKIAIGLISNSISRACKYEEIASSSRMLEGSKILKTDYFNDLLERKKKGKALFNIDYTVLKVLPTELFSVQNTIEENIKLLWDLVSKVLRTSDYVGMGNDGEFFIVLSNSGIDAALKVISRLYNNGISTAIVSGD